MEFIFHLKNKSHSLKHMQMHISVDFIILNHKVMISSFILRLDNMINFIVVVLNM